MTTSILALLTPIFAITTAIGAAIAGLIWGAMKTLRATNEDLRNRVSDLEAERLESKNKIHTIETDAKNKIHTLETDLAVLTRMVTGEAHWEALHDLGDKIVTSLTTHHTEAMSHWTKQDSRFVDLARSLEALRELEAQRERRREAERLSGRTEREREQ